MTEQVDIWEWTVKDAERLRSEGGQKTAILDNYDEFWRCFVDDPIGADLAIHNAIDAARACNEVRWELHLRHWRIQNWVRQSQVKRMLPEAIDLLDLALDERVKDVPQRICAYHDVVECYVEMDPAGYYEDIKTNSEHILSQLAKRYPCADCARANLARSAATAGKVEEAEHWLAEHEANRHDNPRPSLYNGRGTTYLRLKQWDNAEKAFREGNALAIKDQDQAHYFSSLLGLAFASIGKNNLAALDKILPHIRQQARYESRADLLAQLMEIEGLVSERSGAPEAALNYFKRSAALNNELGCLRQAAETALHAAELAREQQLPEPEEILALAVNAVSALPEASQDLYQRLAALGREPIPVDLLQEQSTLSPEETKVQETRQELLNLEEVLQTHLQGGNIHGIIAMLFRLGTWHNGHDQSRAAVDYFIWSASLERLSRYSNQEREDSLLALQHMHNKLPAGAVSEALRAAESAPPLTLLPMLAQLPAQQWSWTIRAIATEIQGQPVVEPRPVGEDNQQRFEEWIEHYASMTTLILRFREQADPAKLDIWIANLEEGIQHSQQNLETEQTEMPADEARGARAFLDFIHGLVALSRGIEPAEVQAHMQPPFDQIIQQIALNAQRPVWQQPGNAPLDFMVEQVAQRTVRGLRRHDEQRASRLANLAFRFELMSIDLRQHEQLLGIARFLDALVVLLQSDGQAPESEPELEQPYKAILAAVYQESCKAIIDDEQDEK